MDGEQGRPVRLGGLVGHGQASTLGCFTVKQGRTVRQVHRVLKSDAKYWCNYEDFGNELRSPVSPEFEGVKVRADPATNEFRLGRNNFLHRDAVSAGGMHSCSIVACGNCNT